MKNAHLDGVRQPPQRLHVVNVLQFQSGNYW